MNIIFFTTSPVMSNLIKNILTTDNVTISTNPNSFGSDLFDLIIIEEDLFTNSIGTHSIPVLLLTTSGNRDEECLSLYNQTKQGRCLSKPFYPDDLISAISQLTS